MKRNMLAAFAALVLALGTLAPSVSAQTMNPMFTILLTTAGDDKPTSTEAAVEAAVDKVVDEAVTKIEVPTVPDEPTGDDVITAVIKNVNDWKQGAWLAATFGLVYILLLVSRLKPISDLLVKYKLKFIKPALAAAFGGLSGAIAAVSIGQPPLGAIVAGVIAGLSSSGFHELLVMSKRRKEENEAAERASHAPGAGGGS